MNWRLILDSICTTVTVTAGLALAVNGMGFIGLILIIIGLAALIVLIIEESADSR